MWDMLKQNEECKRFREGLEEAATKLEGVTRVESLLALLPEKHRGHAAACADCREAANDLVKVKALFSGAATFSEEERPWFAARVMAAIVSHEKELAERVSTWTEFPRFASRLAWVAAIVLLAGSTWFYESVVRAPRNPLNGSQESIFEVPQQTTPDDVLVSMAGDTP
jgi:hypothetical protein